MKKSQDQIICENSDNPRLDKFLTEKLSITRSQIKNMIEGGLVLVNSKQPTVHCFLRAGDKIEIKKENPKVKTETLETETLKEKKSAPPKIKIVADEPDYIVVEKPIDLLVHPTSKKEKNTLAKWIIKKFPEIKKVGESEERPGIIHRLDKDVSGLMIIAKNQKAYIYFKKLFKKRKITKKYSALVYGVIERDSDTIDYPIGRSHNKPGTFAAHPIKYGKVAESNGTSPESLDEKLYDKDKEAITKFKVIKQYQKCSLLEVEILTGRTHQIRVHLFSIGHPVVGDKLYQIKSIRKMPIDRIFLHADYLAFKDPAGIKQEFKSKLPLNLKKFIGELKDK